MQAHADPSAAQPEVVRPRRLSILQRLSWAMVAVAMCVPAMAFEAKALDDWITQTIPRYPVAGLTVVVVQDGRAVFDQAYGVAAIDSGEPLSIAHAFHLASVSKPVVAVAVMQLVESGKIDLDAPVSRYLPYFTLADARVDQVTARRLLAHTAGMPDVDDYEWDQPQRDDEALERWVRAQSGKSLLFDPGSDRRYSNVGYEVLGDMVAKVSGESFEDYIANHIFAPLDMHNSSFVDSHVPLDRRVSGHTGVAQSRLTEHYPYNRRHAPSSTFHANGPDMARWLSAFSSPERLAASGLLNAESIAQMWTVEFEMSETAQMTLGWFRQGADALKVLRHGGGDDGFRSEMTVFEGRDSGYALMTNSEGTPVAEIRRALQQAAADLPLPDVPRGGPGFVYAQGGVPALVAQFAAHAQAKEAEGMFAIYALGRELLAENKHDESLALAEGMVGVYGDHHRLQHYLAQSRLATGDPQGARAALNRSLEIRPGFADAQAMLDQLPPE